ncbi:spore coat U domain-containing protein [Paracidovorax anthurii]|uniref:Spore coat protein U-like protein n=1 Tax=Paracidovorax anthurii TaxID=78229 RepID=A0A328YQ57_9BURK|nr:spore coat U domain-containing protein [Paracidovorax anthurii]RAR75969.1 spore coat protein U-like protein [Paracidovorax anthurii]WCM92951.1 spore coat U domain-containing protein [Acidovorax sp. NCPPB 2350]
MGDAIHRMARRGCAAALRPALCVLCLAQAAPAVPANIPTTATFSVNATIVRGCMVAGQAGQVTGVNFGTIDFGTHSAVRTGSETQFAGSGSGTQALIQCTPGTAVQVTADAGQHAQGAQRRLSNSAGAYVPYALALVAGTTAPLTPNVPASLTLGATATALPLQGTVTFPGFGLPAGSYTDTVQVTLSW